MCIFVRQTNRLISMCLGTFHSYRECGQQYKNVRKLTQSTYTSHADCIFFGYYTLTLSDVPPHKIMLRKVFQACKLWGGHYSDMFSSSAIIYSFDNNLKSFTSPTIRQKYQLSNSKDSIRIVKLHWERAREFILVICILEPAPISLLIWINIYIPKAEAYVSRHYISPKQMALMRSGCLKSL